MAKERESGGDVSQSNPTLISSLIFAAKVFGCQLCRAGQNANNRIPKLQQELPFIDLPVAVESKTPLWSESDVVERNLERGKVHNLRLATKSLDLTKIPKGAVFSFWNQLGPASRIRGFVVGRQLKEGCVVPAVGGGLCQLSNALYDVALKAGFEVLERHSHTRVVPGSVAEIGRDATVAWNHIDLRFRSKADCMLRVKLSDTDLIVQILGIFEHGSENDLGRVSTRVELKVANSCATCGQETCFRQRDAIKRTSGGRTAFLLDQSWPEFSEWVAAEAKENDMLFSPTKGSRYNWVNKADRRYAHMLALDRSFNSRKLASSGPERRAFELRMSSELARKFASWLRPEDTHLVVDVKYLATLLHVGALGGRTCTVLMSRWPISLIHRELDQASDRFVDQMLLRDFRADPSTSRREDEALEHVTSFVTPHPFVANFIGSRAELLPWKMPARTVLRAGNRVLFSGAVAARKGAYLVRDLARDLGFELRVVGSELEGADFWQGCKVCRAEPGEDPLDGVAVVVLPAFAEEQPRLLIRALQSGIPVVASPQCGLDAQKGLTTASPFDYDAFRAAIVNALQSGD